MGSFLSGALGGQTGGAGTKTGGGVAAANNGSGFYNQAQLEDQVNFLRATQDRSTALGSQLQGVANGTGPNPALSQLQATTQQNIGSANAQLAANRNLNPALAAKMANQNLVQGNQVATNQAATLSGQQQLGAMSQLGNLYGQQEQGSINEQNTQNNANLGAQKINSGIGQQNASNASSTNGALLSSAGGAAGFLTNGATGSKGGSGAGVTNGIDPSATAQPGDSNFVGPLMEANGGMIPAPKGPTSRVGMHLAAAKMAGGGSVKKVDAILSPGEKYLTPAEAREVAKNKEKVTSVGKKVPGKAKVPGNDLRNDTVPAKLDVGGLVIPRSEMTSSKDAAAFVKAHFAKRGKLG